MVNFEELQTLVNSVKGTTFAGLTTTTNVKLSGGKKNPQQGRITKRTESANIILFSNSEKSGYESMVRKRMISEGKDPEEFKLKPRAWGQRIGNSPFIEHNGKKYLECIFVSPGTTTYYEDGVEIDPDNIEGLPEKKEMTETQKESQGGIENKVILRTFSLDSIVSIKIKNEEIA